MVAKSSRQVTSLHAQFEHVFFGHLFHVLVGTLVSHDNPWPGPVFVTRAEMAQQVCVVINGNQIFQDTSLTLYPPYHASMVRRPLTLRLAVGNRTAPEIYFGTDYFVLCKMLQAQNGRLFASSLFIC